MRQLKESLKDKAKHLKVLYVEDEEAVREAFGAILSKYFAEVVVAVDGKKGLDIYRDDTFDLVLTDIRMPVLDGLEMLKKIKKINFFQRVAVISAYSDSDKLMEFINLGVDGFLQKPIKNDQLVLMLYKVVKQIDDEKMAQEFEKKLIDVNAELEDKVQALNRALKKVIAAENMAITAVNKSEEIKERDVVMPTPKKEKISAVEFEEMQPFDVEDKLNQLEIVEEEFDIVISRIKKGDHDSFLKLETIFKNYSDIIGSFDEFAHISYAIESLSQAIKYAESRDVDDFIQSLLYSVADNLVSFRKNIFLEKTAVDIHYMDDSMIADITLLSRMLKGEESEGEDVELF
ncbi:MAG: response regulator [Campylobacterales bacterium]